MWRILASLKRRTMRLLLARRTRLSRQSRRIWQKDDYPTKTEVCVTVDSGCAKSGGQTVSSNSAFNTAMAGVAKPPTRVPNSGTTAYGIYTNYSSTRTYNGDPRPLVFTYFLQGTSQQCGIEVTTSNVDIMSTSTLGYTSSNINGTGKTLCIVSVPAP